jgi:hypothetical protein
MADRIPHRLRHTCQLGLWRAAPPETRNAAHQRVPPATNFSAWASRSASRRVA